MILYSIIPPEIVFDHYNAENVGAKEINYLGEKVIVVPLENNQVKIERILSTSPQAFLNPKLQPGAVLSL